MTSSNPFTDSAFLPSLYGSKDRLERRTGALHRAKVSGSDVAGAIAAHAADFIPQADVPRAADIGCGRGSTTLALLERLPAARVLAVDMAWSMLQAAQSRLQPYRDRVRLVRADFHGLPFRDRSCHLGVAAFCLYHSREPASVIAEIARCLSPHGTAILVTKSVNSYHELDRLVAATGLDHEAHERPSLYETAHSTNLPVLAASSLDVVEVLHDEHVFRFDGHAHLAEYLSTVPKYRLSAPLRHDPQALAAELRRRTADRPVITTSTVTYVVARRTPIA